MNEKHVVKEILKIPLIPRIDDSKILRDLSTLMIGVLGIIGMGLSSIGIYNISNAYNNYYLNTSVFVTSVILWVITIYASDVLIKVVSLRSLREWVLNETR